MTGTERMVSTFSIVLLWLTLAPQGYAAGDPLRGKQLAVQCFACHGVDGNSPSPVNPKIGGQHEQYLLLALKAYAGGGRPNSLMSGAVLDKSEQDLEDLAAYFANQKSLTEQSPSRNSPAENGRKVGQKDTAKKPGPPRGPGGPGMAMQFNHGERDSEFTSMLARVRDYARRRQPELNADLCPKIGDDRPDDRDRDNDGLADRFDAAPTDAGEFVADRNDDGYFEICNIRQLSAIASLGTAEGSATTLSFDERRTRSYQLVTDLDADGIPFAPIGNCGPTGNCMRALGQFGYAGVFDGRGHVIRNLLISEPERGGVGLFGVLGATGIVMHLKLENVRVSGRAGVGAVVGSNFGTLYHCEATGEIGGMMAIGGLVGGSGGLVYRGYFSGRVDAKQAVGGLVGDMTGAVFSSAADAEVTGIRGIGGLVGLNTFGSIMDSHATGNIKGSNDTGGLVGVNTDAKVRNSFATGRVTGDSTNIGGLVGFNSQSIIRNSYATGEVGGADAVGGLVGRNKGIVANGYAAGRVSSAGQSGAVVGVVIEGNVTGVYDAASADIGGLTGQSTGWSPEQLPVVKPLKFFCDRNGNGYIDPDERVAENYIWTFDGSQDKPKISCIAGRSQYKKNMTG
jgi:cytochrome c553